MLILRNEVLFYLLLSRAEHFQHKLVVLTTTKLTAFSHTWPSIFFLSLKRKWEGEHVWLSACFWKGWFQMKALAEAGGCEESGL